jgi:pSer/pThr/pTyr-binding forkhead associated (FHA) protein/ribosomal protein L40E
MTAKEMCMASVFCTKCGQQNDEDAHFCSRCGTALRRSGGAVSDQTSTITMGVADDDAEDSTDEVVAEALPSGSALLVVRRGPNAGSRFLLDEDLTSAGRHPDSDIFLDDVTVSRRHAEFVRTDDGFVVRDVGSLNGTYANRERIEQVALASGDEVQIGKFRLVFLAADPR